MDAQCDHWNSFSPDALQVMREQIHITLQIHPETGDPFLLQSCKSLTQYLVKNIGSFPIPEGHDM